jgi:hypothetical protein
MAEDKRPNPYPYPTAEEFEAAPGSREQKAARCIAARRFDGIPTRAFLLGGNDHSPLMQGLVDFTTAVYKLIDRIEDSGAKVEEVEAIREMMESHGCPSADTTEP